MNPFRLKRLFKTDRESPSADFPKEERISKDVADILEMGKYEASQIWQFTILYILTGILAGLTFSFPAAIICVIFWALKGIFCFVLFRS